MDRMDGVLRANASHPPFLFFLSYLNICSHASFVSDKRGVKGHLDAEKGAPYDVPTIYQKLFGIHWLVKGERIAYVDVNAEGASH